MRHGFDRAMTAEIARMSLPIVVGMLSHTTLQIADTAMVGRLGTAPLAAVGLGSLAAHVALLVCGSLSVGAQAIAARRLGERRTQEYHRIAANAFVLALAVGVAVSAAGAIAAPRFFPLLTRDPAVARMGSEYLAIRFAGLFSFVVMFALSGFTYGVARVKIDMLVSLAVNACNIALNWFLIYGHWIFPRLEVRGAAIASAVSTLAGLALYVALVEGRILRRLPPAGRGPRRLSAALMKQIVRISAPRAVQSLSIGGFVVFLSFVGRLGTAQLAVSNVIFKAFDVTFMIGIAMGAASATLVGRSLGERRPAAAERYGLHAVGIGMAAMGTIGLSFVLFPRFIMGLFTSDAAAIEAGVVPFRMLGAFQAVDAVGIVLSRTLQGVGCTRYVMLAETAVMWGVLVPAAWAAVAVLRGGLALAWSAVCLYIACFAAAMYAKFREGGWKRVVL